MNREYYCPHCGYEEAPEEIKRKMREKYAQMTGEMEKKREMAREYIKSNPEKSVILAAGTGLVIGMVLAGIIAKKGMRYKMYQ